MSSSADSDPRHFAQPEIRRYIRLAAEINDKRRNTCWYSQFWPYGSADDDPIFYLSTRWNMQVWRIDKDSESAQIENLSYCEVKAVQEDQEQNEVILEDYCSAAWAYITEDEPLLLGAGDHGYIRVFNATSGDLKTTLVGHGKGVVNELATHPRYPWIFASASVDQSIRIWDLRRWDSKHESPTVVICGAGNGHQASVMTLAWHQSGRYLISGGFDNRICVWTIPDLAPDSPFWSEIAPDGASRRAEQVRLIHYPHFTSSAIHNYYVDCIVFWSINGFQSSREPPDGILAPKASEHLDTRNGFTRIVLTTEDGVQKITTDPIFASDHPFQRLVQFEIPDCEPFFIRFDLLTPSLKYPDIHPVLACGNVKSLARFWDLEALDRGYDYSVPATRGGARRGRGSRARRGTAHANRAVRGGLSHSDSAPAIMTSVDETGANSRDTPRTGSAHPSSVASSSSRALPTDDALRDSSEMSERLPPSEDLPKGPLVEPPEDRNRFPLTAPSHPLEKAHFQVDLSGAKGDGSAFTSRAVAWSPNGRYCVIVGETFEWKGQKGRGKTMDNVQMGMAVLLERAIPA
ncbi:Polycomb protein eed [Cyphellophora attinorum]|uniref:Polycomb protein eed n=1 Tax=Cyphellophora attinorum TaxID=1664694 RepID=A0A0N0NHQ8_9EURO|nr:Polycomb protein eed [Phialophora attinorum]KPI34848.1 Polycomb protein eed [Phialophora attinorum]